MRLVRYVSLLCVFLLAGCASVQTAIEYADLEIAANTKRPVFLRGDSTRNLFLVVDCPVQEWASLPQTLARRYEQKGYTLVTSREQADVIMALQIRRGDMEKHSARAVQGRRDMTSGASAFAGGGMGYLISSGDPVSAVAGAVGGLVVGGLADATINSWVYMGILEVYGDILVVERLKTAKGEWWNPANEAYKETETGVTVRARQSGLKWETAAEPISNKLLEQLVSVLPAKR